MQIGNREFKTGNRPYIMGILNVTPDSFSDGGCYTDIVRALRRTCFVIEAIKENFNIPVSLDTCKAKVAQAGILAGADLINDIWGFQWDDKMAKTVAEAGVACCLMHNRHEDVYEDFVNDVVSDLQESIDIALSAGVSRDKIMIDPGIGFAKSTEENLIIMNNLDKLTAMNYPVLLGTSRKSVIGNTLDLPVEEREEGTMATSVFGLMSGGTLSSSDGKNTKKR